MQSAPTGLGIKAASAVVFAYHNVGVRGLLTLLDAGIDVRLVVTHTDNPNETLWFGSVAAVAAEHGLPCITPADPHAPEVLERLRAVSPDFLFSLYYRQMLKPMVLDIPRRGAFNMHGSLLPRYRGRAPVNWAVLHGERETGATLHVMHEKPDHGPIVDQCAVPILGEDTARQVFDKVTLAAEIVLARSVPRLIAGTATFTPQVHIAGHYFGGRKPEDGRIPVDAAALDIHNLVRAVAPPDYPGAFFDAAQGRIVIGRTRPLPGPALTHRASLALVAQEGQLWLDATDGHRLHVLQATFDGRPLDAASWHHHFGDVPVHPHP